MVSKCERVLGIDVITASVCVSLALALPDLLEEKASINFLLLLFVRYDSPVLMLNGR